MRLKPGAPLLKFKIKKVNKLDPVNARAELFSQYPDERRKKWNNIKLNKNVNKLVRFTKVCFKFRLQTSPEKRIKPLDLSAHF